MEKNILRSLLTIALFLPLFYVNEGCVGAKANLEAPNIKYPVSFTDGIYDHNYALKDAQSYTVIDSFSMTVTKWSTAMTLYSFTPDEDLSDTLNHIIMQKGGDGVVDLNVTANNGPLNFLTGSVQFAGIFTGLLYAFSSLISPPVGILGFASMIAAPGSVNVDIEGKVIRFKE